ncbi:hypothetical protein EG68_03200 [Paragonimus skrjabini miyazakii]|uniref:CRAL-TRIO domain-containing protein n=1 Tax=Paragonimus skrjabini miyazakii TaxID=59628 RepID=A0A8S9YAV0_9TREM|nr:hypothetical protein EG68_03200 [Paragonimus skrjabini miyazakii]
MTPTGCHPRLGYDCAQIMSNHYPERLGLAICIRPGSVFKVAWQAMKPFLPPATASKVCIVGNKSQLQPTLERYFSQTMTKWILDEYKSNRRKPESSRYRPFWMPQPDDEGGNPDPRGEKHYVEEWITTRHSSGHLPHPNVLDYVSGKLRASLSFSEPIDVLEVDLNEEDENCELDEATAGKILASLPEEYQIPANAEKLT